MKFCTSCGAQIADNQTFCAKCGKPINNTQNARPAQYNAPAQTAAAASVPAAPETFGKKSGLAKASKALGILGQPGLQFFEVLLLPVRVVFFGDRGLGVSIPVLVRACGFGLLFGGRLFGGLVFGGLLPACGPAPSARGSGSTRSSPTPR